jgi:CelD/BcsL family acetyltransferase involved in cellulose biosynthesis
MTTLAIDVVTTDADAHGLAPLWDRLWRRVPDAVPFQSPRWLLPWWDKFGTGRPVLACLRREGRLAGILPLYLLDDADGRKLLPVGVSLSDYFDVLLEPGLSADTADALLAAALRVGADQGATLCDLNDVPPDAMLRKLRAPGGWHAEWRSTDPCPVLRLPDDAIGSGLRRKLRMNAHRAERLGGCRFEWSGHDHFATLLRWNAERWGTDAARQAFFRDVAPGLFAADLLRLGVLRIGDTVAACCSAMPAGADRLLFYMIGFDPAFAHASPGSLLLRAMMDAAVAEDRHEMHFLRGGERYKYGWGAHDRYNAACRLTRA